MFLARNAWQSSHAIKMLFFFLLVIGGRTLLQMQYSLVIASEQVALEKSTGLQKRLMLELHL